MKRNFFFVLFLGSFILSFAQGTGYVSIQGKQFKDENGNDFYPMVMNYSADIVHDANGNYFVSPSGAYGNDWGYGNDNQSIANDFTEIYAMGFNTVRLIGPAPFKEDHMPSGFKYTSDQYPNPYPNLQVALDFFYDYTTDANMIFLLDKLDEIVQIAAACSLKVILVPARGLVAQNSFAAGDYSQFLRVYAAHFATNPTIMAYDLYNEPTWSDQTDPAQSYYDHTKSEVCGFVHGWYHSIKDVSDPNHLVTMGLNVTDDLFEWDPGVLTLDFASEHIYFNLRQEENYDWHAGKDRYMDKLLWLNDNLPMPWIIGETSFAASDNDFPPFDEVTHTNPDGTTVPGFNSPPWNGLPCKWGSTADQLEFVQWAIPMIRNCGASGMAWWQFQDVLWFVPWSNPAPPLTSFKENYFGLLNPGDWNSVDGYNSIRKAAVAEFVALNHQAPALGALPSHSVSYYNPYNFPTNSPNTISGTVKNFFSGDGIKDAVVPTWSKFESTDILLYDNFSLLQYTFSESTGILHCYPAFNQLGYFPTKIDDIKISAPGCERIERGWTQSGYNTPSPVNCDPATYSNLSVPHDGEIFCLKTTNWNYDAVIENQVIDYNRNLQGWNSLSVSNVTVLTSVVSEFKAREEIHITGDFHAEAGSEVHIYTTETFPECLDFSSYLRVTNPYSENVYDGKIDLEIEVNFTKPDSNFNFIITPNPSYGEFKLKVACAWNRNIQLSVFDLLSNIVYSQKLIQETPVLNFSNLPRGLYFIQLSDVNSCITHKLILQ